MKQIHFKFSEENSKLFQKIDAFSSIFFTKTKWMLEKEITLRILNSLRNYPDQAYFQR